MEKKNAGEMKRGERRKDVWYRCKQGGEENVLEFDVG